MSNWRFPALDLELWAELIEKGLIYGYAFETIHIMDDCPTRQILNMDAIALKRVYSEDRRSLRHNKRIVFKADYGKGNRGIIVGYSDIHDDHKTLHTWAPEPWGLSSFGRDKFGLLEIPNKYDIDDFVAVFLHRMSPLDIVPKEK